jgi:hypothetical protein
VTSPPARAAGVAAILGGALGLLLAPILVAVKYATGWAIVPEPAWIAAARPALDRLFGGATPVELWQTYGRLYTLALLMMFAGVAAFAARLRAGSGRFRPAGIWILLAGLVLVIGGDAVHTATWHQDGLTVPTPGTNPVANAAYAVHMMGMNLILIGSLWAGVAAVRRRLFAPWLAWLLILVTPFAVGLSLTLLPTSPSGGLWLFSLMLIVLGSSLLFGRPSLAPTFQR